MIQGQATIKSARSRSSGSMADFGVDSGNITLLARRVLSVLAGIQAGVIGGLAMLVVMSVVSVARHNPWWAYPNLLATALYGGRALHMGPGWPTLAGISIQILTAGIAGLIFGVLSAPVTGGFRMLLLGVIWGLAWFYLTDGFYRATARLIPLYAPEAALLAAHTVFGLILGRMTRPGGQR
jgi:hypothetical protein